MDKKNYQSLPIAIIVILLMIFVASNGKIVNAQECSIIRIQGGGASHELYVYPQTTSIAKGTCVIWINTAGATKVKVVFEEGKKCEDMTEAPSGFKIAPDNCYVTSWIPLGGTSSLRFVQGGTFQYEVQVSSDVKVRGTIVVQ